MENYILRELDKDQPRKRLYHTRLPLLRNKRSFIYLSDLQGLEKEEIKNAMQPTTLGMITWLIDQPGVHALTVQKHTLGVTREQIYGWDEVEAIVFMSMWYHAWAGADRPESATKSRELWVADGKDIEQIRPADFVKHILREGDPPKRPAPADVQANLRQLDLDA